MEDFFARTSTRRVPILDIGDREGTTGYIDFLTCNDLSHYCMRGIDKYGRPFLTLRVSTEDEDSVGTIFQRYNTPNPIVFGTCYRFCPIHYDSLIAGYQCDALFNRINCLLAGESVITYDDNTICYIKEVRKQIADELDKIFYRDLVGIILQYI